MEQDIFTKPEDVTREFAERLFVLLTTAGVAEFQIKEAYVRGASNFKALEHIEGEPCRCVIAALHRSHEIMVALEGSGCVILQPTSDINPFVFVQGGFQLTAATILTKVIEGLAEQTAQMNRHLEARYPQLTHRSTDDAD